MKKGFTLIELLVVIAIIGILAGISLVSFGGAQRQANDAKRKSDLKQYQNLLETYANKNEGMYPKHTVTSSASETLCTNLGQTGCPYDVKHVSNDAFDYFYQSNGPDNTGNAGATQYVLWAKIENTDSRHYAVCSSGKVGEVYVPDDISGGTCPIP
jgi:prepilin-type N-terminal cleavage/methylation domain-containing protein